MYGFLFGVELEGVEGGWLIVDGEMKWGVRSWEGYFGKENWE